MTAFSILFETDELRDAINDSISQDTRIGELSIHHTDDGRAILVSPRATENLVGYYIPCHDKEEAEYLADCGVTIFCSKKMFDSLSDKKKNDFLNHLETKYQENTLLDELALQLELRKTDSESKFDFPVSYHCSVQPILLPVEMRLLKTETRSCQKITINVGKISVSNN